VPYRFATEDQDYSDYASGRVLYNLPGQPALPVRLSSEIFQRSYTHWLDAGGRGPVRLYDHLAVLGLLHGNLIEEIYAADIDATVLKTAALNLGLLSPEGMDKRIGEIQGMLAAYNKDSHQEALASAIRLKALVSIQAHTLHTHTFQANALVPSAVQEEMARDPVDMILTDVPYGWHSTWLFERGNTPINPLWTILEALQTRLSPVGIVAVICDKEQKAAHSSYHRLERIRMGRRQAFIFRRI
jgi:hypothetical protein